MKLLLILLVFTFIQLNLAQLDFSSMLSNVNKRISSDRTKIQSKVEERGKHLPKYEDGTVEGYASKFFSSTKDAVSLLTKGIRNATANLAGALIATGANAGFSLLLGEFKVIARTTGVGSTLPLPSIAAETYGFRINASGGYFKSLSSLTKYAPISVHILSAESLLIDIPVKFNEMFVAYQHLSISGFLINTQGNFSVEIGKNSILIQLKLGMDSTCAISIEKVEIKELDGISIKIYGLVGFASSVASQITNYIISWIHNNIARYIESAVAENLQTALGTNQLICSGFMQT